MRNSRTACRSDFLGSARIRSTWDDIDTLRISRAKEILPAADLRTGDAPKLPWDNGTFRVVIASTLFTSVLDSNVRCLIADEIIRVLAPGGALLWYEFAFNNPRHPHVRGISRSEVRNLFPRLTGKIRSVTLAPPLARLIVPHSWALATLLESIPFLRTHLLAVLIKSSCASLQPPNLTATRYTLA